MKFVSPFRVPDFQKHKRLSFLLQDFELFRSVVYLTIHGGSRGNESSVLNAKLTEKQLVDYKPVLEEGDKVLN